MTPAAVRTRSPRALAGSRLYRALAYRRRYVTGGMRAAGLGVLMQRVHRLTQRTEHFWRFADEVEWQLVPADRLGRLPLCLTRSQVEQLMRGGAR